MNISRRSFAAMLAGAPVLAACSTTTTGTVTTITLNVASVDAWGQASINAAQLMAALPGIAGTGTALAINAIGAGASTALAAFDKSANGQLTLTFDKSSAPAAVTSLLNDGETLLSDATAAMPNVPASSMQTAQLYISALKTIVSLFQAAMGATTAAAAVGGMTEDKALTTLGVKRG